MKLGLEPADHAIGRSRIGLTSKIHMATDGKGRMLSAVLTAGNINDTTMMAATLEGIRVPRSGRERPRTRPAWVLADKGYTSRANRVWLGTRHQGHHPGEIRPNCQPEEEGLLRRAPAGVRRPDLQRPQRRRAGFQPAQKLAGPRHEIRRDRAELYGRRSARRITRMAKSQL